MFQILMKDSEGRDVLMREQMPENEANKIIESLRNSGVEATKVSFADRKWHCANVVFDMQSIDAAKKSFKSGREIFGMYTFGDPNNLAKEGEIVKVKCTDGRVKNAYVVGIWLATATEINQFKTKIGCEKLGLVMAKI